MWTDVDTMRRATWFYVFMFTKLNTGSNALQFNHINYERDNF